MELYVVGCHGGETPRHRTSAFVLDGKLAIDAGALTSGLELRAQRKLAAVLVSHAHLDHIRDLATIADNRVQTGEPPLVLAGTKWTVGVLRKHFFNGKVWPDFAEIPSRDKPAIRYQVLKPEVPADVVGYTVRAILVSHTIETTAFVIQRGNKAIGYSGDTGPTDRLWEVLNATPSLCGLMMEVSFPDQEHEIAVASGHHTPRTLAMDLKKFEKLKELPVLLYHIKPVFEARVERECARLKLGNLEVMRLGDSFIF